MNTTRLVNPDCDILEVTPAELIVTEAEIQAPAPVVADMLGFHTLDGGSGPSRRRPGCRTRPVPVETSSAGRSSLQGHPDHSRSDLVNPAWRGSAPVARRWPGGTRSFRPFSSGGYDFLLAVEHRAATHSGGARGVDGPAANFRQVHGTTVPVEDRERSPVVAGGVMSLLDPDHMLPAPRDSDLAARSLHRRGALPDGPDCPRGPGAIYLLSYNDPDSPVEGYPLGWTLTAWHASAWRWSAALAAHGAGALAGPRQAKAVALRALAERGVALVGWSDGASAELPTFRATLRTGTGRAHSTGRAHHRPRPARDLLTSTGTGSAPKPESLAGFNRAADPACPDAQGPRLRVSAAPGAPSSSTGDAVVVAALQQVIEAEHVQQLVAAG